MFFFFMFVYIFGVKFLSQLSLVVYSSKSNLFFFSKYSVIFIITGENSEIIDKIYTCMVCNKIDFVFCFKTKRYNCRDTQLSLNTNIVFQTCRTKFKNYLEPDLVVRIFVRPKCCMCNSWCYPRQEVHCVFCSNNNTFNNTEI